ncbi:armadillo-type protein [Kalaharituber pfeilii]|nr:armadillo-type protein [Kalaharituber pfeilii]
MPKERKKRGRRAEQVRRKQEEQEQTQEIPRHEPLEFYDAAEDAYQNGGDGGEYDGTPFFGLLDEQEKEYFRQQDEILTANAFESDEDRSTFITNLLKEADGKELKLISSQGCSRLLERVISFCTPSQLKNLFQKCNGNFIHLVQHRFASHFCESLFVQSAFVAAREEEMGHSYETEVGEVIASMESLFLYTLNELEPQIYGLLTHPFASHTIRILLLVLSGKGTTTTGSNNLIQSRRKENQLETDKLAEDRKVPDSFKEATSRILSSMQEKLSVRELRILSTHPVGSPTLQLLLRIELTNTSLNKVKKHKNKNKDISGSNSKNTLLSKLLNGQEEGDASATSFLQDLFYDSIGSHLLETIVQFSNQATFEELYNTYFKNKIGSMARNETASFVVQKVVTRLEGEKLQDAMDAVIPLVPNLLGWW